MIVEIPQERLNEKGKPLLQHISRVSNEKYKAAWYNHNGAAKNDQAMMDSAAIWTTKANTAVLRLDSMLREMK
jgi:hypothetical protein